MGIPRARKWKSNDNPEFLPPIVCVWVLNIGGQVWQQVPFIHNQAFYNKLYCGQKQKPLLCKEFY